MTATADTDTPVLLEIDDGVAILSFHRPDRANSWSVPMEQEYYRLLGECERNPEVRVIVVTGTGKTFCPGMDANTLSVQANGGGSSFPHRRTPVTYPRTVRKPIIAAINGACAGIGLIVAMNCDLRFTTSRAKITTSFSQRGIMAEHGLAWSLPKVVGTSTALDLLFSARVVQGPEALELGLVDRVFEPETFMAQTLAYAHHLATSCSPVAMGIIKQQVYEAAETSQDEARTTAIRWWYDTLMGHPDFREGISAFLEKRDPHFAPWDPATPLEPAPLPLD